MTVAIHSHAVSQNVAPERERRASALARTAFRTSSALVEPNVGF